MKSLLALALFFSVVPSAQAFLVDSYEPGSPDGNMLKGKANVYQQGPSRIPAVRGVRSGVGTLGCLLIIYDKQAKGGPYDSGGWIGYYEVIGPSTRWFDGTRYKAITFWVRGEAGGENFKIGLADRPNFEKDESVKSRRVSEYLPDKKITQRWQKAVVPLSEFFVYTKELASVSFCFEGDSPLWTGQGRVYIDELSFE